MTNTLKPKNTRRTSRLGVSKVADSVTAYVRPFVERRDAYKEFFTQLEWRIRRTGTNGMLGLALLAGCGIFLISTHLPLLDEIAALQGDLATAQSAAANRAKASRVTPSDDPAQLLSSLPSRPEVSQVLSKVFKQAEVSGINIDTGKYDFSTTRSGSITKYNFTFPVSGGYASVRGFVDAVLRDIPAITLSEFSVQRKGISETVVEADIRLTLFVRREP